jgi:3-oxoacyl-[acyl-carrier protein] reductase
MGSGLALDVTDGAAVQAAVERIVREWGRLDIVVTAAGILHRTASRETTEPPWARVIRRHPDRHLP